MRRGLQTVQQNSTDLAAKVQCYVSMFLNAAILALLLSFKSEFVNQNSTENIKLLCKKKVSIINIVVITVY